MNELIGPKLRALIDQQLAAIIQSSDDAILVKDLRGVIHSWNGGAERLFGYSANEVIGKSVTVLIPPDREGEEPRILRLIASGERLDHFKTVRCRKDGSLVDISLSVTPIRDGNGRIVGATKVARDISETRLRHQQQNLLVQAEEWLAAILSSSADAILTCDLHGAIQNWNRGAERLFGYRTDEAIGRTVAILVPEDRYGEIMRILYRVGGGERIEGLATVRRHRDGRFADTALTVTPIRDASGAVAGVSLIARDFVSTSQP